MTDKQNIIEISNLNVYAGDRKLLSDISVNIPRGTITVIMGPSGCGKTTLLRSLNRLTDLSGLNVSGHINFSGKDILSLRGYDVAAMRQRMGLLSQRPYPLPLSIYENIAYAVRLKGITRKTEVRSQVEHYLQLACLWDEVKDRLNNSPSTLSIGQQQRLCLARGLAVDPEVILADEPTSALDPISTQAIEQSFMQLKNDYTIILVSHILRQARRIADYVVFMYLSEMIESGEAQTFFLDPKNEITKKYLEGVFY